MANNRTSRWREWLAPWAELSSNWISATGVVLVTAAAIVWIITVIAGFGHEQQNPYTGILLFMVAPAVFITGLLLIPLGMWLVSRRRKRQGVSAAPLDLSSPRIRRLAVFVAMATFANIIIVGHYTYSAVEHMESVSFCGTACHTVMQPEHTAYLGSPHARVSCVKCHIGPGASWFVKSKLDGTRQVLAVAFNTHSRPIEAPVENLRPSRDTCEGCHWPEKFGGERLRVLRRYAEDEKNTQSSTVLMMHIGGGSATGGIHGAHVSPGVSVRYGHSDRARQEIQWVEIERPGKDVVRYTRKGGQTANASTRVMDCVDCHNRPTHIFELPQHSMDRLLASGEASVDLPFLKKQALEILKTKYTSREEALRSIPLEVEKFYREQHPQVYAAQTSKVKASAQAVRSAYARNVFPEMNVQWGTYINNIGHNDFPGCFRCHGEDLVGPKGETISQDCSTCHEMLAMEETAPKILTDLGMVK